MTETDEQVDVRERPVDGNDDVAASPPHRRSWTLWAGPGALLLLLAGAGFWLGTRGEHLEPAAKLKLALKLLDQPENLNALGRARKLAKELEEIDYRDPDNGGAIEYILGIAAFRHAEKLDEATREQMCVQAADYLRKAERRAFVTSRGPESRRPEWAHALGTSLHYIGSATEARPLLEEAFATYAPGKTKAAMILPEIYLDQKTPDDLKRALALNSSVIQSKELDQRQHDRAYLQRARIFHFLNRDADAEAALSHVQEPSDHGTIVFRAQTLMAEEQFQKALEKLRPVATGSGLEQIYARQALYLMGVCHEQLGVKASDRNKQALQIDSAIDAYKRTAKIYPKSHEGLAANLRLSRLLQAEGRNEEALDAYRRALRTVRQPKDFRNRWLGLTEFRRQILTAWNAWADGHAYQEALALSRLMTPLFPAVQANELAARSNQRWAEQLEIELKQTAYPKHAEREQQVRERWRSSGRAFADLAEALQTSPKYSEVIWTSAEHYRKGHDFKNALEQLQKFIASQPKQRLPTALVRRGEVLIALDRLDDALRDFQRVIAEFPTDPAAFEAQYIIGQCYLERNELAKAEKAWETVLASNELKPSASEWRMSLFSLGRLLYRTAVIQRRKAKTATVDDEANRLMHMAFTRLDQAVIRLDEFLKRYPNADETIEARYYLAKALQYSAEQPRRKLQLAETENARLELRGHIQKLLRETNRQFRLMQSETIARHETGKLDQFGQRVLKDSYFEIAHTYYALQEYDQAIAAYRGAANKYPKSPEVLLAYVQMTDCYDHMGQPDEARSMLQQAKVILNGLDADIFKSPATNMSKQEWQAWIDWASRLH